MEAVKLEGGKLVAPTVKAIVNSGLSVMGHIGLTPQLVAKFGGYKVQGKTAEAAEELIHDALSLQDAGCFSIVLEAIPAELAKIITSKVAIPTIGIGAGKHCDGQVLVFHDLLGMYQGTTPGFVKQYVNLNNIITKAITQFSHDVQQGKYPAEKHTFNMNPNELIKLKTMK
jgi:3-methyl-2-oxobutanoate hydroxymethyltransferase